MPHRSLPTFTDHCAFPIAGSEIVTALGLTKREYFAVALLQGILANSAYANILTTDVETAIDYADALINELNK